MNLLAIVSVIIISLCFFAGLNYLWNYFRRKDDRTPLMFSLACFALLVETLLTATAHFYPETGVRWAVSAAAGHPLFSAAVLWFVYYAAGSGAKKPFIAVTVLLGLSTLVGAAAGFAVPGGAPATSDAPARAILLGQHLTSIAAFALSLGTVIARYRAGHGRSIHYRFLILALSSAPAALALDFLSGIGALPVPPIAGYAFTLVIVAGSHLLQGSFMDLYDEIRELNIMLEERINDGVMDMFLTEIGTRLYVEMLNDLSGEKKDTVESTAIQNLINADRASSILLLSREIAHMNNVDKLLAMVVDKIMKISYADSCTLFFNEGDGNLVLKSFRNDRGGNAAGPEALVRRAFEEGIYILTDSGQEDLGAPPGKTVYAASIPILSGERVAGVCHIENILSRNVFTPNDALLLMQFLSLLAVPMEKALGRERTGGGEQLRQPLPLTARIAEKLERAIAYIKENYQSDISREGLAASLNMHPDSLGRFFKIYTSKKISEFINDIRVDEAARMLREGDRSITDIAYSAGFESLTTFNRVFRQAKKISPARYREKSGRSPGGS